MKIASIVSGFIRKNPAFRPDLYLLLLIAASQTLSAQNISGTEPVQWVGRPNSYSTVPYNADYRTTTYRKLSTTAANPADGRGQWSTTINVQASGADITPDNMPGGAGAGWLLISGPPADRFQNKWNFSAVAQATLNAVNDLVLQPGGEEMGLNMGTAGYYTFNMRDAGYVNTACFVGYTSGMPVSVSRTSEVLNNATNGTIISITTGNVPSAGENIFVRYRTGTNDFTTGTTVIQAFGSNTSYSVEIPAQDCGTNVYYYVYSSTRSLAQINTDSESDRSLGALRYDDNAGTNYTYLANTRVVTASAGPNGTLIPVGTTTHTCGDDVSYTITPNECYVVEDVLVDGISQGAISSYTFTGISGDHSIIASFVPATFTINASAGTGGSISPSGAFTANCGDNVTFTVTADPCFSISGITVDGIPVGALSSFTFNNINASHSIVASFSTTPYTIFVTQGSNGTISPGSGTVNCGADVTYTITPDPCYRIADVIADGVSVGAVTSFSFNNVLATHTITAVFVINSFTISAVVGANGTITPAGVSTVNCGSNNIYEILPDLCYHIVDVLVDGISQGAISTYTFSNTTANHTISASFALNASLAAPVVSGPVNVCAYVGASVPVTYTAASQGSDGFDWVLPPNVSLQSSTQNSITVLFNTGFTTQANRQLRVTALSPCGNSSITIYYLQSQAPGTPGAITGNTSVCAIIGTANSFTYSIPAVPGAASYIWSAQAGTTTITHTNGAGMNDTTVTVSFTAGFTSSSITVQAVNNCGVSGIRSISLVRTLPATPSPISGPTNVCANIAPGGTPATYSVPSIPGVTYNWTLPAGAAGITGQGTASISFIYPAGYAGGTISVVAVNGCGASAARSLNVNRLLPSATSAITGVEILGCPDRIVRFSVAAMPAHATSVIWTFSGSIGAVLISGQGTTSIDVSFPEQAATVIVTATATSNCASSAVRSLTYRLAECNIGPPPPGPRAGKQAPAIFAAETKKAAETMQVNIFPNPTVSDFKLQALTAGNEKISVRILDLQGRVLKRLLMNPNQVTTLGSDLEPGSYMVEIRQGSQVKITKLIKF